jgi:phosphatidylglycerol:prolipoprotein diacylglycerol transferase
MKSILFHIGPVTIYSYGLMVALGVLSGIFVIKLNAPKAGVTPHQAADLVLLVTLTGFMGARLLYVIEFWGTYKDHIIDIFKMWQGGLVYYGGMITAIFCLFLFSRLKHFSFLKVLDLLFPSLALGQAFGRVGCFLNGCCYGKPATVPWAISFPFLPGPVHPTQLYESLYMVFVFLALCWAYRKSNWQGEVTLLYLVLYSAGRLLIEFYRGDHTDFYFTLTISQWVSLGVLSAVVLIYPFLKNRFLYTRD